jgi:hypothetical protein
MKSTRALTALGITLAVAGSLIASPSTAMAATTTINFDCDAPLHGGSYFVLPGNDVTFTSENCDDVRRDGASIGSASVTIDSTELSVTVPLEILFDDGGSPPTTFYLLLSNPNLTSLAPLELAREQSMTISGAEPSWFTADAAISDDGLGGNPECQVDAGEHPFTTTTVTITTAGEFTFRISGTSPNTDPNVRALELESAAYKVRDNPIYDPFLAVYSAFDPDNPNDNIVGCDDDGENLGYLDTGMVFFDRWPQFSAFLPAGTYTLVLSTFDPYAVSTWDADTNSVAQTATMQLWGTAGAISPLIPGVEPTLAATGASQTGVPLALTVALLGFGVLFVGASIRRRRQRQ